jgi:uncharacterized protein YgiM (DUF1202 family)
MHKFLLIPILILTACSFQATPQSTPTVTPLPFATATLIPTLTPHPSATAGVPTVIPTISPVSASLTAQVNVRAAPDAKAISLGLLNYGTRVQVIGKDASGKWWQVIYPENSTTAGWVSAEYAPIPEGEAAKIPVAQTTNPPAAASALNETPLAPVANSTSTPASRTASVKAQIFVRAGPGQTYDSLGTVNAGTIVTLTGRNENNVWVQIQFDGGLDGIGWVAAAYLEGADLRGLPYFDNQGKLIFAPTAVSNPGQPTVTATAFSAAAADGDSEQNPAVRLKFSPDGAGELTFSSTLSSPSGDTADWVAFTPYEPTNQSTYVYFKLECSGNGGITAILEKNGIPVPEVKSLVCGNYDFAVQVLGGQEYMLVLSADGSGGGLRFVSYNLYIKSKR